MNMKEKVEIKDEYLKMIFNSWTWDRLYPTEKDRFINLVNSDHILDLLKGTKRARWNILNGLYESFLIGVGYTPTDWRE